MVNKEYTHANEDIVIHHLENPRDTRHGNHAAWFDGGTTAVKLKPIYKNQQNAFPQELSGNLTDASLDELKSVLNYMAEEGLLSCSCGRVFDKSNAVSTGFAGVKCGECAEDDSHCEESEDNTHSMETISGRSQLPRPTHSRLAPFAP